MALKIAQIAPLYESCPPRLYGGTERVVAWLTDALVDLGHEVTLFASGDSRTRAELVPACPQALRLDPACRDPLAHHMVLMHRVARCAHAFDILHFHTDYLHFPLFAGTASPVLTTLHGRLDLPDLQPLYREFTDMALVSISDAQRRPLPFAGWRATVHHGLPADLLTPGRGEGGYLTFIGRISPEKRPDRAILIARAAGIPLKIAAKVDAADRVYFDSVIRPLLDDPLVEFVGEIGEADKSRFLGGAAALLFPIDWPEPFGLVMIEAMAAGTPVLAFDCGSVPEIVEDGLTGVIVSSTQEAVAALPRLLALPREAIRRRFEERFGARRMALDYIRVYEGIVAAGARTAGAARRGAVAAA